MFLYFCNFILPIRRRRRWTERERDTHTSTQSLTCTYPTRFLLYIYTNGSLKERIIFATSGLIRWFAGISPELTIFLILVPLSSSLSSGPWEQFLSLEYMRHLLQ